MLAPLHSQGGCASKPQIRLSPHLARRTIRAEPIAGQLKTSIILIDFENVQPKDLTSLRGRPFKTKVFCGANQTKIPFALAAELQPLGPDAEYIRIQGTGRNALDFHIAYYIGRLAAESLAQHSSSFLRTPGSTHLSSTSRPKTSPVTGCHHSVTFQGLHHRRPLHPRIASKKSPTAS